MTHKTAVLLLIIVAGICLGSLAVCQKAPSGRADGQTTKNYGGNIPQAVTYDGPLVVAELFTSQGCSSCPPADRVLAQLGREPDVLPLSFHVDYWNYIGWRDPFSSARWSARQREYARALSSRTYTPQLVVDGQVHLVGSRRSSVKQAIDAARQRGKAAQLKASVERKGTRLVVEVRTNLTQGQVLMVVLESGHLTRVASGENAGEALVNQFVVRELVPGFNAATRQTGTLGVELRSDWSGPMALAILQQEQRSREILGARALAVPPR